MYSFYLQPIQVSFVAKRYSRVAAESRRFVYFNFPRQDKELGMGSANMMTAFVKNGRHQHGTISVLKVFILLLTYLGPVDGQ